jgi:PAS domain S-box-containing protein
MSAPQALRPSDRRAGWWALAFFSLLLLGGSWGLYRVRARQELKDQHQVIAGIGALNLKQIVAWREDRLASVQRMVQGPLFRWRAEDFLRNPRSEKAKSDLQQVLRVSKMGRRYTSAFLVSLEGTVLLGSDPIPEPLDPATRHLITKVQQGPEAGFSDFFTDAKGVTLIDVAALVRGTQDQPLAVALLRIEAESSLFALFKQWPIPTETAEAALVYRQGNEAFVPHPLRHAPPGTPHWHQPLSETHYPAVKAVLGDRGLHECVDYRGRSVIADLQPIPDSPWFLITKVDKDEALAQLYMESILIGIITFTLILLAAAGMAFHFRRRESETFRILLEQEQSLRASEQARARQAMALEASEQRFRDLVASTDGIVWEADATTFEFTDVSQNAERLLGYPADAWLRPGFWSDHLHPEDREQAIRYCAACTGRLEDHDFEYRFLASDGRVVWIRDLVHVVQEGGRPRWLRGLMVDITAQKRAEEERLHLQSQLQQSQKMESLGSLAGGVAHDMNNVLGAILGLASANLTTHPEGSPTHRAFETITKAAKRGAQMVQRLLAFARQSPSEAVALDVNALLREETHLLERTTLAQVDLQLDLAPDLKPMVGDPSALAHAFMNLCVNAVDAMPTGGTLTLRTRNVDPDQIEVGVEDTGSGMPPEVRDRALDPFFTTKPQGKGTGLGLSMAYTTVKAHQGTMDIQSQPEVGTRILLRFPAIGAAPAPGDTKESPDPGAAPRSLRVLLVDDDELIQQTVLHMLEALGHSPRLATSGEAALAILESGYRPEVVILDMNMPGLGGRGTLPRLRELCPDLPVILATGRADQVDPNLLQADPKLTLLPKPFALGALRRHLAGLPTP